ncbi:flippase [Nocardioides sp.]|jgi:O-antigen/teichoic acid export membrane protein|uniref:flippase n=1 Tax=Nocardioides sp. TaxID=35761 RepID=UPI002638C623|nr:flippase [Nocardioides sp.]
MTQTSTPQARRPSLARDRGRSVLGAVVSNVANVLVILVIARMLGVGAVGEYTLAFAVRAILLLVCGLGMRTAMTRFVAAHLATGDPGGLRGAVVLGVSVPVGVASVVALGWFVAADALATSVFDEPELATTMQVVALSLPFFVLVNVALAATQGFSSMQAYVWIGQVLEPGLRFALTLLLLLLGGGTVAAASALLAASVVSGIVALATLVRMVSTLPPAQRTYPGRALTSFAATSWVASMATQGLLWADVVILGALVSTEEVGVYQVAARVVLIGMFVITALNAAVSARIATAWVRGDIDAVDERYTGTILWSSRLTWPMLAGLVAVPTAVLQLFGAGFGDASTVVLILAVGAAAEVLGAPSAVLLNQIGRNGLNLVINVSSLVVNVGLNFALIPVYGINGAAFAWAFTMAVGAVVRVVTVRRVATGRWPWSRPLLVSLGAALAAALLAELVTDLLPANEWLRLAVAAVLVIGLYGSVVVLRGLSGAERDALSRAISLRLPQLRRWRVQRQLRHAGSNDASLRVDDLISPFRADVLARADLFRLAREHADLRVNDEPAFLRLARAGGYGAWFDEVLVHKGHVPGSDPAALERTFRSIVRSSLQLLDRQDRLGRESLGRVTVTRVPAGTEIDGWSLAEDRWVLVDGGHRVALALLDGVGTLTPAEYAVVNGQLPPNNTARLLESGRLAEEEAVQFLARGLVPLGDRDQVHRWRDLLDRLATPGNREVVEAWPEVRAASGAR